MKDDAMSALRPKRSRDDTSPDDLVVVTAAVVGSCGVGFFVTAVDDSTGGAVLRNGAGELVAKDLFVVALPTFFLTMRN